MLGFGGSVGIGGIIFCVEVIVVFLFVELDR